MSQGPRLGSENEAGETCKSAVVCKAAGEDYYGIVNGSFVSDAPSLGPLSADPESE
jgi:hypothetical protein